MTKNIISPTGLRNVLPILGGIFVLTRVPGRGRHDWNNTTCLTWICSCTAVIMRLSDVPLRMQSTLLGNSMPMLSFLVCR